MSLLDKAKSRKLKVRFIKKASQEEVELSLAWLRNDISMGQVQYALGIMSNSSCGYKLSRFLRQAYLEGWLEIV